MDATLAAFYDLCSVVLSPSDPSDESLRALGVPSARIARWDRGVDTSHFDPAQREPPARAGELTVPYAGRHEGEGLAEGYRLALGDAGPGERIGPTPRVSGGAVRRTAASPLRLRVGARCRAAGARRPRRRGSSA
jgi:hypothetical protein